MSRIAVLLILLLFPVLTPLQAQDSVRMEGCPGTISSRLEIGGRGQVVAGQTTRVRDVAGTSGEIVATMRTGEPFDVVDGPTCLGGYAWWQVLANGVLGWSAEGSADEYWLEPLPAEGFEPSGLTVVASLEATTGSRNLYRIDSSGRGMSLIYRSTRYPNRVLISPDGKHMAWTESTRFLDDVYLADIDGENVRQLNSNVLGYTVLAWSPDSKRLAFGADSTIYIADVETGHILRLETLFYDIVRLEWSPDGTRLLFLSSNLPKPNSTLLIINPDGSGIRNLGENVGGVAPQFSPDSKQILMQTAAANGNPQITYVDLETEENTTIKVGTRTSDVVRWSPDGTRLLFVTGIGNEDYVVTMNTDGSDLRQVASHPLGVFNPIWSPDGSQILYVGANRSGVWGLYVVDAKGGAPRLLVETGEYINWFDWQNT